MNKQDQKAVRAMRIVEEQHKVTRIRATFVNFRRKLEGGLAEDESIPGYNSGEKRVYNNAQTISEQINGGGDQVTDQSSSRQQADLPRFGRKIGQGVTILEEEENDIKINDEVSEKDLDVKTRTDAAKTPGHSRPDSTNR